MKQSFAMTSFIVLLVTAGSALAAPTWTFDDPCDVIPLHNADHCIVVLRDGLLKVGATGTDPYFFLGGGWDTANWEPFDGATYSTIYMRLKVNIADTWQVYYTTEENSEWGEEQRQDFFNIGATDGFVDVAFVMERGGWQERTIKGLRIDPGTTAGVIAEIDYISLEGPVTPVESGDELIAHQGEDNMPTCLVNLLDDTHFRRGFVVWDPAPGKHVARGTLQPSQAKNEPVWRLAQWHSQFSLAGAKAESLPSGAERFFDGAKSVTFGPPGSPEADLILAIDARNEYQNHIPEPDDAWSHLLAERELLHHPSVAELQAVRFRLNYRLLKSETAKLPESGSHRYNAAIFVFYITVQNLNRKSSGFGDYLWFGLVLYDSRSRLSGAYAAPDTSTPKKESTGKFIFQPDMNRLTQESAHDGTWVLIDADLLPFIRESLEMAWNRGYLKDSRDLADYRLGRMNMGWEVWWPLDLAMQVKDLEFEATVMPGLYTPWLLLDISDQTIPEGDTDTFADIRLDDHVYDFGSGDTEMVWTYSGNTALSINISGDNISTISVPDPCWSGSETIKFTATAPDGESKSDSATFTVFPSKTAYVTPSTITLEIGDTQQFSISVYTLDDQKCEVTNSDMLWTVEGDIGSIDADGLFTAQSVGSGSIKATLKSGTSVVAQSDAITVKYPPWDVNGDGMVDISDLMLVGNALGMSGEGLSADVNADGVVDILDFVIVAMHYGEATNLGAPSAVRPPSSVHTNMLEQWLKAARAADDGSEMFRRGIVALEHLLINIIPERTALLQNYPNPFNPDTWIPYQLRDDSDVIIRIYTSTGQLVRTLNLGHKSAGIYTSKEKAAYWDGRNEEGEKTASGIYFYNIKAGDFTATKKMTIVE